MDNPGHNQHFNVLIWVGGRGGLRISTLCTIAMICITKSRTGNYDFRAVRAREVSPVVHFR